MVSRFVRRSGCHTAYESHLPRMHDYIFFKAVVGEPQEFREIVWSDTLLF